ncbi:MAG TPA: hypothetical protein VLL25_15765 [Acidimicrobiales bacterium]|nr:hypothetical protein [Acidimicrobiales bacterium]
MIDTATYHVGFNFGLKVADRPRQLAAELDAERLRQSLCCDVVRCEQAVPAVILTGEDTKQRFCIQHAVIWYRHQ